MLHRLRDREEQLWQGAAGVRARISVWLWPGEWNGSEESQVVQADDTEEMHGCQEFFQPSWRILRCETVTVVNCGLLLHFLFALSPYLQPLSSQHHAIPQPHRLSFGCLHCAAFTGSPIACPPQKYQFSTLVLKKREHISYAGTSYTYQTPTSICSHPFLYFMSKIPLASITLHLTYPNPHLCTGAAD